jgi:hypothetical protein
MDVLWITIEKISKYDPVQFYGKNRNKCPTKRHLFSKICWPNLVQIYLCFGLTANQLLTNFLGTFDFK